MKLIVKYTILGSLYGVLGVMSFILGGIMYLWKFSKKDFRHGTSYINENLIKFTDWFKPESAPTKY
jgi:predicted membrane channel-forming protein YqfA (hemolysin III family)